MNYKIVVDSCCELPGKYKNDERFQSIPLGLEVGDYAIQDDENYLTEGGSLSAVSEIFLSLARKVYGSVPL